MLSLIANIENAMHYISNGFSNVFYNMKHLPAVVASAYSSIVSIFDYFPEDLALLFNFFIIVALLLKLVRW